VLISTAYYVLSPGPTAVANTDTVDQRPPTVVRVVNRNVTIHLVERLKHALLVLPARLLPALLLLLVLLLLLALLVLLALLLLLHPHHRTILLQDVVLNSAMLFVNRPVTTVVAKMDTVDQQMPSVDMDANLNVTIHPVERLNLARPLLLLLKQIQLQLPLILTLVAVLILVVFYVTHLENTAVVDLDTVVQQLDFAAVDVNLNATINQAVKLRLRRLLNLHLGPLMLLNDVVYFMAELYVLLPVNTAVV